MDVKESHRYLNKMVEYGGKSDVYMLTGVIMRREINGGPFWYQVELTDTTADILVYDCLEAVKPPRTEIEITEVTE